MADWEPLAHNASEVLTYVPPFSPTAISLHAPPPQPEDSLTRDTHAPTYIQARHTRARALRCFTHLFMLLHLLAAAAAPCVTVLPQRPT